MLRGERLGRVGSSASNLSASEGDEGEQLTDGQAQGRKRGFHPRDVLQPIDPRDAADLLVGGPVEQMLWRTAAYYLGFSVDGARAFDGVTVVLPPSVAWNVSDGEVRELLSAGFAAVWDEVPARFAVRILGGLVIHRCKRFASSEVVDAVKESGAKRICLVAEASKYRDEVAESERVLGQTGSLLAEDIWVPHLVRMTSECLRAAKGQGCALVFHSNDAAVKRESKAMLEAVDQLYPLFLTREEDARAQELLANKLPQWIAMAVSGRSAEVFDELAKEGLSPADERQIRLNISVRTRDAAEVQRLVREYLEDTAGLDAESAGRLGRLAHQFGDDESARSLFATSMARVADQAVLVISLDALTTMGEQALLQQCWERLYSLFPDTPALAENREYRLILTCDSLSVGGPPSRAGFGEFECYVADALYQRAEADYDVLLEQVAATWPARQHLAALCISLHALGLRDLVTAMTAALFAAQDEQSSERACWILLDVLRRLFLDEVVPEDGMEVYKLPLIAICRYLARNPNAAKMRAELTEILDVELAGTAGLAVVTAFTFDVISAGAPMPTPTPRTERSSDAVMKSFVEAGLHWMGSQPAIEPGVTKLPTELVIDDPQRLVSALERFMHFGTRMDGEAADLETLENFAFLICLLAPFVPNSTVDLGAIRQLAAKSWLHHRAQHARDLAEQLLSLAGSASTRRRIAWGGYADILHHTGSTVDALVGLACAAMTGAQMTAANLYQEAYVLLRVARDLGFMDMARSALATCRALYEIEGMGEQGRQRLDGVELSLDVARASALTPGELLTLLERARAHCAEVLAGDDEIFSAAAHFLQIAGMIERSGQELPAPAVELRASLHARNVGGLLYAVSTAFPTAEDVVELHNQLETARYAANTADDQRAMVVAAHRLLLPRVPDVTPVHAAVAVELLSDRSLRGSSEPLLETEWPAEFACELSRDGTTVLMLGLDSDGELAGVVARNGEAMLLRPAKQEISFSRRLSSWSADYPYKYGLINRDDGNGEVYFSMGTLNLPLPAVTRLLVVAQPALQQIPLNVALVDGEFAGMTTAIGAAPSLSWLRGVHALPRSEGSRRLAWISCSPESEAYGTLEILYARLSPVFKQHGFETDISGAIPADTRGANLAVLTAHGQLSSEDRFIRRIADEQKFIESPLTLARALAGVELVILFVCSGGRVDRHPFANTTVSLPKMLLDRGCRAVVASPWPLDGNVPGNWLGRFLEAWEAGDTVIDANFKANRYVNERLGPEAPLCLAMSVYGDVLLRKANVVLEVADSDVQYT